MVFVPLHQVHSTVDKSPCPRRIAAKTAVIGVMFNICFVPHIKTQFVAKVIKLRSVRVVTGTDGVDIMLFHQLEITEHIFTVYGSAFAGMAFVAVHPAEKHSFAIDQKLPLFDLLPPEPYSYSNKIHFAAVGLKEYGT